MKANKRGKTGTKMLTVTCTICGMDMDCPESMLSADRHFCARCTDLLAEGYEPEELKMDKESLARHIARCDNIDIIANELKKYPKVMAIVLFGSYARNKMKPLSDIDIAVLVNDPDKSIEAEIAGFSSNIFDVVVFHKLPLYIQFEVFKFGKPIFVKDKKYFSQIKREVLRDYLEMSYLYERLSKKILAL